MLATSMYHFVSLVISVGNEMTRAIVFLKNFYCFICRKIIIGFFTQTLSGGIKYRAGGLTSINFQCCAFIVNYISTKFLPTSSVKKQEERLGE